MTVKWWALTDNKYLRFIISQMAPFGIHFSNSILYRAELDQIPDREKPPLTDLDIQVFGPDDWDTVKTLGHNFGLSISTCIKSSVIVAFQDGKAVGHVCSRVGTYYDLELEREEIFDDGIYLSSLFVSPAVRRRGVARVLVMSALEHAERHGVQRYAYAYVRTDNLASRCLFESLRFKAVSVTHYLRAFGLRSYKTEALQRVM